MAILAFRCVFDLGEGGAPKMMSCFVAQLNDVTGVASGNCAWFHKSFLNSRQRNIKLSLTISPRSIYNTDTARAPSSQSKLLEFWLESPERLNRGS
jgi:hypothetical protein